MTASGLGDALPPLWHWKSRSYSRLGKAIVGMARSIGRSCIKQRWVGSFSADTGVLCLDVEVP